MDLAFLLSFTIISIIPLFIHYGGYKCSDFMKSLKFVLIVYMNITNPLVHQMMFYGVISTMSRIQNMRVDSFAASSDTYLSSSIQNTSNDLS